VPRPPASLAKTTRPSAEGIFPRTQLFRLLDRRRRSPIVWLAGPPGSGKTSLVARVDDPTNILHRLLPSHDDRSYRCLSYVDWYGDTVFNYPQMKDVVPELMRMLERAEADDERHLVMRMLELARKCEQHQYLCFIGD
jgi:hypothetical protein